MSSSKFAPNRCNACSLLYLVAGWLRDASECSFHMWGNVWVVEFWLKVLNECLFLGFQVVVRYIVLYDEGNKLVVVVVLSPPSQR